jgi:hypothetical protein
MSSKTNWVGSVLVQIVLFLFLHPSVFSSPLSFATVTEAKTSSVINPLLPMSGQRMWLM